MVPAGGGAVWRTTEDGGIETVVVHRPKYDDWSLPKGKLEDGEHVLAAAVREVTEETGLEVVAGRRGLRVRYPVRAGTKQVDYWLMEAVGGTFEPNDEVDELRWLPIPEAARLCSYAHDRTVLEDLARTDVPRAPTLLLVRHADAGDKHVWSGPDDLRPLDRHGRAQARRLAEVLPLFGPAAIASAPRVRCRQTVEPLAEALGLGVTDLPELGEEEFTADPQAGLVAVERLLEGPGAGSSGVTVACSQGGAIPSVLLSLGVRWQGVAGPLWPPAAKGSVWALAGRPGALVADYYRDFEPGSGGDDGPPAVPAQSAGSAVGSQR